jgi:hypothetical protein
VDYKGGRNGARGPSFSLINMRAGYRFRLTGNRSLQAHLDVFNVANHANFNNPTGNVGGVISSDRRDTSTFLVLRSIRRGGPTRTAQFNLRYVL